MGKHKEKSKKHQHEKKHKKKHRRRKSSSSSSSSNEEWVEKKTYSSSEEENPKLKSPASNEPNSSTAPEKRNKTDERRDDWMSLPTSFLTESHLDRRKQRKEEKRLEKERNQYNPREHIRELNPYWKDGGDGLPKFKKPSEDSSYKYQSSNRPQTSSSWRKRSTETVTHHQVQKETDISSTETKILSEKEMNVLASKLVKAEIMGKTELVKQLKEQLDKARQMRENSSHVTKTEEVILTQTDSQGHTRPLRSQSEYGEFSGNPKKKKKMETHKDGQRVRYFADDDKHSLQQMFENEKFNTVGDQNSEFIKMAGKIRKNDDADEIFADNIRKKEADSKIDKRNKDKAVHEHERISHSMDNCKLCLQSDTMQKHLMITLGETAFLCLPPYEPLTEGHCLIVPIRHVTCSTLLDENEWNDIMDFRRSLTNMFRSKNEDVIFFETAKNLEKYPHMYIECIPIDEEEGNTAPIYFKKAIDECEAEWAQNKKLVSLKGKNVRRAVPKGLPYFFVSFGMEEGYAHVIEDQKIFPNNFAQEIIGGMLDLHHSKWRKPKYQTFDEQSTRVLQFSQAWNKFECTKSYVNLEISF